MIAGHTVVQELGRGASSRVFEARAPDGGSVALKWAGGSERLSIEARVRFEREAQLLSMLSHPNVVRMRHFGTVGDACYMGRVQVLKKRWATIPPEPLVGHTSPRRSLPCPKFAICRGRVSLKDEALVGACLQGVGHQYLVHAGAWRTW